MSLAPGTRLGPYEIVAPIGAGGMGEVYRARDAKLNRTVAIKVLPESLATDADRLMRFEREAQMLAALNHPHIAQIYGLEGREGQEASSCIVMELVEGPTLADRIGLGPIPFAEALSMATQIADALAAAHDHGIVHRDLKPANIKVRGDGVVKVLDFGLAKTLDPPPSSIAATTSPTLSVHATQAGIILGTAAYMAPEQALGKAVDKRADIWAFGVVLFEMLTGRRPFGGGDEVVATIASVVKDAPLFADLSPETPAPLRRLLRRCLEKDPRRRLADIADARLEIADALEGTLEPAVSTTQTSGRRRERAWQLAAALLAVVAAAGWWSWSRAVRSVTTAPESFQRVDLDFGSDLSLESIGPAVALSPDGTRLVYVSKRSDEPTRLLTRLLEEPKPVELRGTEDAYSPFFSPDGRWVGFFAAGKLKKVRVDGGQLVTLCEASAGRGASWSEDGSFIVAALDNQSALVRIPAEGGTPAPITKFAGDERSHRWPQVLPGHNRVLFTVNSSPGNFANSGVAVVSFGDSGPPAEHRILFAEAGMNPRYLGSGYLTFVRKGTLYAAPFDVNQLRARGEPVPVLDEVSNEQYFGGVQLDLSRVGSLVYHRGATLGLKTIQWLDSAGTLQPLLGDPSMYTYPRVSPDGERLAVSLPDGSNTGVWVYAWRTGTKTRITDGPGQQAYPVWSPDGRYIVFAGSGALLWGPADAAQRPKVLMAAPKQGTLAPLSFTPDGQTLAFSERGADGKWSIKTSAIRNSGMESLAGNPELFVDLPSGAVTAAFSPDGRWLAYTSAESGVYEVYVRAFPDKRTKRVISSGGGMMPTWAPDGKTLFYRTAEQRIMAVTYSATGDAFAAQPPRVWSDRRIANTGMTANLDIAPDGTRFAVLMPAEAPEPLDTRGHFTFVPNFVEEVRRRLTR